MTGRLNPSLPAAGVLSRRCVLTAGVSLAAAGALAPPSLAASFGNSDNRLLQAARVFLDTCESNCDADGYAIARNRLAAAIAGGDDLLFSNGGPQMLAMTSDAAPFMPSALLHQGLVLGDALRGIIGQSQAATLTLRGVSFSAPIQSIRQMRLGDGATAWIIATGAAGPSRHAAMTGFKRSPGGAWRQISRGG